MAIMIKILNKLQWLTKHNLYRARTEKHTQITCIHTHTHTGTQAGNSEWALIRGTINYWPSGELYLLHAMNLIYTLP